MMAFLVSKNSATFTMPHGLLDRSGNFLYGNLVASSSFEITSMENNFYYDLEAVSKSIQSDDVSAPDWVQDDADFIKWIRSFKEDEL